MNSTVQLGSEKVKSKMFYLLTIWLSLFSSMFTLN